VPRRGRGMMWVRFPDFCRGPRFMIGLDFARFRVEDDEVLGVRPEKSAPGVGHDGCGPVLCCSRTCV